MFLSSFNCEQSNRISFKNFSFIKKKKERNLSISFKNECMCVYVMKGLGAKCDVSMFAI